MPAPPLPDGVLRQAMRLKLRLCCTPTGTRGLSLPFVDRRFVFPTPRARRLRLDLPAADRPPRGGTAGSVMKSHPSTRKQSQCRSKGPADARNRIAMREWRHSPRRHLLRTTPRGRLLSQKPVDHKVTTWAIEAVH